MTDTKKILHHRLQEFTGRPVDLQIQPVGGGSINETYCIHQDKHRFFCKINSATKFPQLFSRESAGLKTLAAANQLKTPAVIALFEEDNRQFLLLEWIDQGERTEDFWKRFGEQLAGLHRVNSATCGLAEDNYMGSVHQSNQQLENWSAFFAQRRLEPLVSRCVKAGLLNANDHLLFEKLTPKLPSIFAEEKPSLLHGDLWSGNFLCDQNAQPILIDPAVYYGHRSMDVAMTTLFGGFRRTFYDSYHYHYPLPQNYEEQWAVCNLYPLLIHLLLFGNSYLAPIRDTLRRFA